MAEVTIQYIPEGAKEVKTIAECDSVTEAEEFIATFLMWADPIGVENGDYSIDPTETAYTRNQLGEDRF